MWTSYLSDRGQRWVARMFFRFGVSVFHHPFVYLLGGLILTAVSGVGFLFSTYENSATYLWVPQDSEIFQSYQSTLDYFGETPHPLILVVESTDRANLLNPDKMNIAWEIFQFSANFTYTHKGTTYSFTDICSKPYPAYHTCESYEKGVFSYFDFDPDRWTSLTIVIDTIALYGDYATYWLGGLTYDGTRIVSSNYMRQLWELDASDDLTDVTEGFMYAWEDYWLEHENDWKSENIEVHFLTGISFNGEVDRVVSGDIPVLAAAFIVMTVYLSLTLGRLHCVEARVLAALSSVLATVCALVMGLGIGNFFDFDMNAIVLLIPFILLGVGVDDDIIIVETLLRTSLPENSLANQDLQFGEALEHAGLSITLTSLSSVIAFAIGSAADVPGISAFCFFACLSFLSNFMTQFLIFVPLLTLDQRRITSNRNFCICCYKHDTFSSHGDVELAQETTGTSVSPKNGIKTVRTINLKAPASEMDGDSTDEESATETANSLKVAGATGSGNISTASAGDGDGSPSATTAEDSKCSSFLKKLNAEYVLVNGLVPILSIRVVRFVLLFLFAAALVGSIVSLEWLDTETDLATLVPDDSFTLDFMSNVEDGYGVISSFDILRLVIENRDFSEEETRNEVKILIDTFEAFDSDYATCVGEVDQWVTQFEIWINDSYNVTVNDVSEEGMYYILLQEFVNTTAPEWQNYIIYDNDENPTKIRATQFGIQTRFSRRTKVRWRSYKPLKDSFNESMGDAKSGYIYSVLMLFAYLANAITRLTINNLIFTAIGVFCALLFLMDLRMSLFIVFIIAMIDIDLFGWMGLFGIPLDTLSYGELVMAVGFTVDYVIHIAHAISHAEPPDRHDFRQRLEIALLDMGVGVLKGGLTTFLGIMTLAFSQSQAFRVFFLMFCGIVVIAMLHGFLLVPILLAEMPFIYWTKERKASGAFSHDAVKRQVSKVNVAYGLE